ncbi:MAG: hypothetical protein LBR66_01845 [Candidatus Symbiothrix sp.]|jgi:hypothetical protein|nr:hypothetical protein [Candidatus Symbiothrix sp.]
MKTQIFKFAIFCGICGAWFSCAEHNEPEEDVPTGKSTGTIVGYLKWCDYQEEETNTILFKPYTLSDLALPITPILNQIYIVLDTSYTDTVEFSAIVLDLFKDADIDYENPYPRIATNPYKNNVAVSFSDMQYRRRKIDQLKADNRVKSVDYVMDKGNGVTFNFVHTIMFDVRDSIAIANYKDEYGLELAYQNSAQRHYRVSKYEDVIELANRLRATNSFSYVVSPVYVEKGYIGPIPYQSKSLRSNSEEYNTDTVFGVLIQKSGLSGTATLLSFDVPDSLYSWNKDQLPQGAYLCEGGENITFDYQDADSLAYLDLPRKAIDPALGLIEDIRQVKIMNLKKQVNDEN